MRRILAVAVLALAIEAHVFVIVLIGPHWLNTAIGVLWGAASGGGVGLCVGWLWSGGWLWGNKRDTATCEHGKPFNEFCWDCVERDAQRPKRSEA